MASVLTSIFFFSISLQDVFAQTGPPKTLNLTRIEQVTDLFFWYLPREAIKNLRKVQLANIYLTNWALRWLGDKLAEEIYKDISVIVLSVLFLHLCYNT